MKWFGLILLLCCAASTVNAAARTEAECHWEGTTLYATGLPEAWSLTFNLIPTGVVGPRPSTFTMTFSEQRTAYFWTRKGSGAKDAPRPPAQYRDYKVIAWCPK